MKAWPYPRIFAHRGGGILAPENTLAAIRVGQALGYAAHELDVKLSRDGVAMLLHDATLERTTSGRGSAGDLDWEALRKLDAGGWHSPPFRGEPIPTFEEAARLLLAEGTAANVEIKPMPGADRETGAKVSALAAALWKGAAVPPLLSSFSFEALAAAKASAPELPRAWITRRFEEADFEKLAALEAVSLHTNHRRFARESIAPLHAAGYRVLLYTIDDPDVAEEWFEAGVDGLFTDNLEIFAQRFPGKIAARLSPAPR